MNSCTIRDEHNENFRSTHPWFMANRWQTKQLPQLIEHNKPSLVPLRCFRQDKASGWWLNYPWHYRGDRASDLEWVVHFQTYQLPAARDPCIRRLGAKHSGTGTWAAPLRQHGVGGACRSRVGGYSHPVVGKPPR